MDNPWYGHIDEPGLWYVETSGMNVESFLCDKVTGSLTVAFVEKHETRQNPEMNVISQMWLAIEKGVPRHTLVAIA